MYVLGTNVAQKKILFFWVGVLCWGVCVFCFLVFFFLPRCGSVAVGESGASLPPAAEMQHVVLRGSSRAALNRL